jgi:hypothetical protein
MYNSVFSSMCLKNASSNYVLSVGISIMVGWYEKFRSVVVIIPLHFVRCVCIFTVRKVAHFILKKLLIACEIIYSP